jgi:hypothetical protein
MPKFLFRTFMALCLIALLCAAAVWTIQIYPRRNSHPPLKLAAGTLVIQHARRVPPVSILRPGNQQPTSLRSEGLRLTADGSQLPATASVLLSSPHHCVEFLPGSSRAEIA